MDSKIDQCSEEKKEKEKKDAILIIHESNTCITLVVVAWQPKFDMQISNFNICISRVVVVVIGGAMDLDQQLLPTKLIGVHSTVHLVDLN